MTSSYLFWGFKDLYIIVYQWWEYCKPTPSKQDYYTTPPPPQKTRKIAWLTLLIHMIFLHILCCIVAMTLEQRTQSVRFPTLVLLLWNSENCEHLENFRNVDCVLANHNKVQDMQATSKPQTYYRCCLQFSYLAVYWLISCNTITFQKYFWCSQFCEIYSNGYPIDEPFKWHCNCNC